MKSIGRVFALIVVTATLLVVLAYAWMHRGVVPAAPAGSGSPTASALEIVIPQGSSAQAIGWLLQDAGLDLSSQAFAWTARAMGIQGRLKAGVYELRPGDSLAIILQKLSRGDSLQAPVTLVEGWTFEQMLRAVRATPFITQTLPESAPEAGQILAQAMGLDSRSVEGWVFPDTYLVQKGSSDQALFERAIRLQKRVLSEAWEARSPRIALASPAEALVMASLIERETQHPDDREWVSAVFHNRLALPMMLQSDPTVIYALGSAFDGNLRKADLLVNSAYNTYQVKGLPPTPIANPGRAALVAALNPAPTRALYFVARGDGSSYFSLTLDQHNHAVDYFQRKRGPPPPPSLQQAQP